MASLFTSQTPASGDNSDGTPGITTATALVFAVDGTVSGIRFWATSTVGGAYSVALWDVTAADPNGSGGTKLATKTLAGPPTPAAWNVVNFDAAVAVVTTKLYKASLFSDDGRYVFTSLFFASPLVNGDITAPANGSNPIGVGNLNQGSFTVNDTTEAYPTTQPGSSCYFVDVVFIPDAGDPSPAPDGIAIPVAVGAPTVALGLAPVPTSLAVPVALGAPTVALGLAPAPTSLAITVGLGAPAIGATQMRPVTPDSLAIPLSFGDPATVSDPAFEVTPSRGSWWSYAAPLRFNADEARRAAESPPVDCPNDGEALVPVADGRRVCPADGWEWPARRIVTRG